MYLTFAQWQSILYVKQTLQNTEGGYFLKNIIEKLRNEHNIKQEDFAKMLGVSRQTISSLENGRYNPSITLAYKISKYFNLTIEEVFDCEDENI